MRNKILYLVLLILLAPSCGREKTFPVIIRPLQININDDIEHLRKQLDKRKASLAYEDSYEGIDKGIKLFYFNDENDSLHYRFDVFLINEKIEGIDGAVFSQQLSEDRLYQKVETEILPDFKKSTAELKNAVVTAERKVSEDVRGKSYYYHFKVRTKELQEKLK